MVPRHPSLSQLSTPPITSSRISAQKTTCHSLGGERGGRGTMLSRTTTRVANELSPPKSACAGDAVLRTSTRGTVHSGTVRRAIEDSISQCPFLQMTYTAENPHTDGSAAPGARPRYRPPRHSDHHATSRTHNNRMTGLQMSCRQQTAPPPSRCSKYVTTSASARSPS